MWTIQLDNPSTIPSQIRDQLSCSYIYFRWRVSPVKVDQSCGKSRKLQAWLHLQRKLTVLHLRGTAGIVFIMHFPELMLGNAL